MAATATAAAAAATAATATTWIHTQNIDADCSRLNVLSIDLILQ